MPRRFYSPDEKAAANRCSGLGYGNLGVGHPINKLPHLQPGHPPKIANFANNQSK